MRELLPDIFRAVLIFIGGGGLYKLADWARNRKHAQQLAPVEQGAAVAALADALTEVARKSVENMSEDLTRSRTELREARQEMREMAAQMVRLETDHAMLMASMKRRIGQLVQVLELNHLAVPPPEDE